MKMIFFWTLCLVAVSAHAVEVSSDSGTASVIPAVQPTPHSHKSEPLAFGMALGGALTGLLIPEGFNMFGTNGEMADRGRMLIVSGCVGLWILPSSGQFYAGSIRQGLWGIGWRTLGAATLALGIKINYDQSMNNWDCGGNGYGLFGPVETHECGPTGGGDPLIYIGSAILAGGVVYSLIDTPYAVKRANEKSRTVRVGVLPTIARGSNGALIPGMAARLTF